MDSMQAIVHVNLEEEPLFIQVHPESAPLMRKSPSAVPKQTDEEFSISSESILGFPAAIDEKESDECITCHTMENTFRINTLSPLLLKVLKDLLHTKVKPLQHLCNNCRVELLSTHVTSLLNEDLKETAQLQEEVMKNIAHYEAQEKTWYSMLIQASTI
jgi:hypothetical protein